MSEQPKEYKKEPEYIITEYQLVRTEHKEIRDAVRSRPHTAPFIQPPIPCSPENSQYYLSGFHDGARKAREDVLDELTHKLIELVIIDGTTEFVKFPRHAISTAINSLRQQAGEQP